MLFPALLNKSIDIFIGKWDRFIDNFENNSYGQHIVLQLDQFISDDIDISQPVFCNIVPDVAGKNYILYNNISVPN